MFGRSFEQLVTMWCVIIMQLNFVTTLYNYDWYIINVAKNAWSSVLRQWSRWQLKKVARFGRFAKSLYLICSICRWSLCCLSIHAASWLCSENSACFWYDTGCMQRIEVLVFVLYYRVYYSLFNLFPQFSSITPLLSPIFLLLSLFTFISFFLNASIHLIGYNYFSIFFSNVCVLYIFANMTNMDHGDHDIFAAIKFPSVYCE